MTELESTIMRRINAHRSPWGVGEDSKVVTQAIGRLIKKGYIEYWGYGYVLTEAGARELTK